MYFKCILAGHIWSNFLTFAQLNLNVFPINKRFSYMFERITLTGLKALDPVPNNSITVPSALHIDPVNN